MLNIFHLTYIRFKNLCYLCLKQINKYYVINIYNNYPFYMFKLRDLTEIPETQDIVIKKYLT